MFYFESHRTFITRATSSLVRDGYKVTWGQARCDREVVLFSWMTGNSDMHCKNFSLVDTGNEEYTLAPAYDLLAVLLANPNDTEEMAMSFTVGGAKSGFDRNTFMTAFTQSGIPVAVAEKMIERMKGYLREWEELIARSFLPEKMKSDYHLLLNKRIELL